MSPQPRLSETKKGPQDGLPATLGKIGFAEDYKTGAQANASWRHRQFAQAFRFTQSIFIDTSC